MSGFGGGQTGGGRGGRFGGFQGGHSGGGGGGRGGRGRGRGRGGGGGGGGGGGPHDQEMYRICAFFARTGNCRNNTNCQFVHGMVQVGFQVKASEKCVRSLAMVAMPDGPRLITGSVDQSVKVWNLTSDPPSQDMVKSTNGTVGHVEVNGSTIMWSVDESLMGDAPGVPVGVVHLLDVNTGTTLPIYRSPEMPYTHPQEVRSIAIAIADNTPFVITAGGEGTVTVWRFDAGKFIEMRRMEGHIRAVTALVIHENLVWSGSADRTLRVWDIGTGKCVGVIGSAPGNPNGHSDIVSCMVKIPVLAADNETYMCSGSMDGSVKLWKANGEFAFSCSHSDKVTSLGYCEELGGLQALIVGLINGTLIVRSCVSMNILFKLDNTICHTNCIWSIQPLGHSCFAVAGEDGQLIMWRVLSAIQDTTM
jgi:WD40 repeat protein